MSVYQSVIFASGIGTRPQKNKSHPLFPNTTVAVTNTPGAARIPGGNLGHVSSALNTKTTRYSSLVPTPTETQQTHATLFTGAGSQDLDAAALLGVAVLLPFVWFLWQ
jgi:hypothetical protein